MLWQILLAVLVCVVLWKLLSQESSDVARLPGPKRLPLFGSALSFLGYTNSELFEILVDFPKQYGYRFVIKVLNRYILHVYNVEDIEIVLYHSRNIKKSRPYIFLEPWLGTGLLVSTGKKWHSRRKILTPAFHFDILKGFMRVFSEQSRNLVNRLHHLADEGSGTVEVMPIISDFTLYTICETAMGIQLDSDQSTAKMEYKQAILDIGSLIIKRLTTVWLHNDFIFNSLPIGKKFAQCLNSVHTFADNVIMERKKAYDNDVNGVNEDTEKDTERGKQRLAFLDLLIEEERKGEIDLEGIREEVNTFMFEGHDTTATALTFGLMLLADHEDIQERILEECKSIFGDSDRSPGVSDLSEMKYLEAVVKEILRLYPSVPFIGRTVVEDFMLDDIKVEKGQEVLVHIYDVQRRGDLFPEPEAFKPERFLGGDSKQYSYVPFSAGPRNCIGQRFAKMEMKCVLSEIVRSFRLQPLRAGARPTLRADLVLRPNEPIFVKFIPR